MKIELPSEMLNKLKKLDQKKSFKEVTSEAHYTFDKLRRGYEEMGNINLKFANESIQCCNSTLARYEKEYLNGKQKK